MTNMGDMPTPDLMTKREAAELLGRDLSSVNKMVLAGKLVPHTTVPGPKRTALYLFCRADVERLAARLGRTRGAA